MNTHPLLEVQLHLVNGSTHKFVQNDSDLVHQTLSQITRKVFAQPSLVIYGDSQAAVYQGAALIGISLIIEPLPAELLMLDQSAATVWEITEEEYHTRQAELEPARRDSPSALLTEIEMVTGRRLWMERHVPRSIGGIEERKIVHQSFSLPSLVCCRRGGGVSIWNRTHMVSMTFSPKPEVPSASWAAERDEEPMLSGRHLCGVRNEGLGYWNPALVGGFGLTHTAVAGSAH